MSQPNQFAIQIRMDGSNQVVSAVQQVQSQFNTFHQTLQAGFSLNLGAQLANAALQAAAGFKQALQEGLRYAAGLKDMSIQIGLTAEDIQVLGHAAEQSGGGIENIRSALGNLRQATVGATDGNEALVAAFKRLNVDAGALAKLPLPEQLEAIAKGFAGAGGDAQAYSALVKVIGERDVPRLQGVLQELAQNGLGGMTDALRRNGALLSTELVDKADQIDDRWGDVRVKFKAVFAEMAVALAPVSDLLSALADFALDLLRAFRGLGQAIGMIAAVVAGTDWKTALEAFREMQTGKAGKRSAGATDSVDAISSSNPAPAPAKGPTLDELIAESNRLFLESQPLLAQRAAALDELKKAEADYQAVIDKSNTRQEFDPVENVAAALRVQQKQAELRKVESLLAESIERQAGQKLQGYEREQADAKSAAAQAAQQQLQLALDAADASARALAARRATLEGYYTLTAAEKWAERKRLLDEEIANQQKLFDLLVAKRTAAQAAGDTAGASIFDQSAREAGTGLARLQNQDSGLGPDPNDPVEQMRASLTSLREEWGTFAQNAADAVNGTLNSALQGASDALYGLFTGTMTFQQAWQSAITGVGQQFAKMASDMVAKMIWRATVERTLTALGFTFHLATETGKTSATAAGSGARMGLKIKEVLADVYHGAIAAFKALAGIPYVGPILGAAAMAAAIAGGMALVGKIGHADGGLITGPGGPRDDRIPAMLSNGEFVATAAAVDRFGPAFFASLNAGALDLGALPGSVARQLPAAAPPGSGGSAAASEAASAGGGDVHLAFHNTAMDAEQFLRGREGRRFLVDFIGKTVRDLR